MITFVFLGATIIFLCIYSWVVIARAKTCKSILNICVDLRNTIMEPPKKSNDKNTIFAFDDKIKEALAGAKVELDSIYREQDESAHPIRLSIKPSLVSQIKGRLTSIEAALSSANSMGMGRAFDNPSRHIGFRQDIFFLLGMVCPLIFWKGPYAGYEPIADYTTQNLALIFSFVIWGGIRLWNGGLDYYNTNIINILDEIVAYALAPIQEHSQRKLTVDLLGNMNESFGELKNGVATLKNVIKVTPDQITKKVEDRFTEKASITESLQTLSKHNSAMKEAIQEHSKAVNNIPDSLSNAVATQICQGLEPTQKNIDALRQSLTTSYDSMANTLGKTTAELINVVRNLSDTEIVESWIDQLGASINGITELGHRLDRYFNDAKTATGSLSKVADAVHQTQERITKELNELASLNQHRGVDEKLHAEKIHELFQTNLEKIEAEHREFRNIVDNFVKQVEQDSVIRETLKNDLPVITQNLKEAATSLDSVSKCAETMPAQYAEILDNIQKRAADNEKELYNLLGKTSDKFINDYHEFHKKVSVEAEKLIASLTSLVNNAVGDAKSQFDEIKVEQQGFIDSFTLKDQELKKSFTAQLTEIKKLINKLAQWQINNQVKSAASLAKATIEHDEKYLKGLDAMEDALNRLKALFESLSAMMNDISMEQKGLNKDLIKALTDNISAGLCEITSKMVDHVDKISAKTIENENQLGDIIEQMQETANIAQLIKRPTKIQIANAASLGGILVTLIYHVVKGLL